MTNRKFDKADFDGIVENLIEYLSSQSQFRDYNFEASGIRTIIELLAYNTQYQLFYLNQVSNESFLDSAILRESVVSIAKHIGYKPQTPRSSRANLNLVVETTYENSPEILQIGTQDIFITYVDGRKHTLTPVIDYSVNASKFLDGEKTKYRYVFDDIELIEGKRLIHTFTVNTSDPNQKFILPNKNIDETSLFVTVKESQTSNIQIGFKQHVDLNEVTKDSNIFFLQETNLGYLELIFGDGVIGKKLDNGNIIEISYVISSGDVIYNASNIKFQQPTGILNRSNSTFIETTTRNATLYTEAESIQSIKKKAPLAYKSQNRAVTKTDYENLLTKDLTDAEFLRVWGGEENDPPQNGIVFISAKPKNRISYSTQEKENILNNLVKSRSIISVESRFVDPEIINLNIISTVRYDTNTTSKNSGQIKSAILNSIYNYRTQYLTGFDVDFRYSNLSNSIDGADASILSNTTQLKLRYRIVPSFNIAKNYSIDFNNQIDYGNSLNSVYSIDSTGFIFNGKLTYIRDNGFGQLDYYRIISGKKVIIKENVGTVDYFNGKLYLENIFIQGLDGGVNYLDIYATPQRRDILAEKNQIIVLDDSDISIFVEGV